VIASVAVNLRQHDADDAADRQEPAEDGDDLVQQYAHADHN